MVSIKSILLGNKTVKQTIFKNAFWLAVAQGVSRIFTLFLVIYVARVLGASDYGKFTFAIAFVYLLSVFSDLGISPIVTREFAKEREAEKDFLAIFTLKIFLVIGTIALTIVGSFFITSNQSIRRLIWILAFYNSIANFFEIIYAFLRARQRMEFEAIIKIIQAVLITTIGLSVIFFIPSVFNLGCGYLLANLILLIPILLFFHLKIEKLSLRLDVSIWKKFLSMSWPLALMVVFSTIYGQTDSIMMGYFGQITQNGWYNAAFKIIGVVLIPATLISQSFYPALSVSFKKSKQDFQKIWNYFMGSLIVIAVPMVIGGILLASKIINFLYDKRYAPSALAFQILVIMAGVMFIYYPLSQVLVVSNQQKKSFWAIFLGAIINIILNLILIPKFSLYGAAIATLATNLIILFLLLSFTLKFTVINPFHKNVLLIFGGAIISSLIMYFVISLPILYWMHPIFLVPIGILVYAIPLLLYIKIFKLKLY